MNSVAVTTQAEARAELVSGRKKPDWREGRHSLPFHELSDHEFEIFCFLLVNRECPDDDVRLYGGSGDAGWDIVHREPTPGGVVIRLIQCKRYDANVAVRVVRADMAKVWANVLNGTIPDRPDELVFYVAPDLKNSAKDLVENQSAWRKAAPAVLRSHLKASPPDELLRHAREWWPTPSSQGSLVLTERARKHPDLVEEFFALRKMIDGSIDDVASLVTPRFDGIDARLGRIEQAVVPVASSVPVPLGECKVAFTRASAGLLRWPTTVSGGRWLKRPELQGLLDRVTSEAESATVLLGPPGSGKSALLARLGNLLVERGVTVLAVKADQLRGGTDSAARLAEWLRLPALADHAVAAVARCERVVVLIDQLDALADLADLKSERLDVLLELVRRVGGLAGVHVVCSCRAFEYQHDGRLRRLDAQAVTLQPPAWNDVSAVLTARGVSADGWPDAAKNLLLVPQHLSVFLKRLGGTGEHQVYTTYQQLFNELWRAEVASDAGRLKVVHELGRCLAEAEELWHDPGRFEARRPAVEALVAAAVLCMDAGGFRLDFRHQLLYEFARAKAFAEGHESLAAHVVARQDALLVRPTLWMTLNYLRNASGATYRREFEALWGTAGLRRHVKHLLVDFLCQAEHPAPSDWEEARLVEALRDPPWRRKVLISLSGKRVWFRRLAESHLSAEMLKTTEESFDVLWVLVSAFEFDRDQSLRLIRQYWLPDDAKLLGVWGALNHLAVWDEAAADQAVAVVRRIAIGQVALWHLAQTVAKDEPRQAVRLVAAWLTAERQRISCPDGGADEEQREKRLRKLLETSGDWYDVGKLAEKVPVEFVKGLWPSVAGIVSDLATPRASNRVQYSDNRLWSAKLDRREYVRYDSPGRLFLALDGAVRAYANAEPDDFAAFARAFGNPNSLLLQRLICRGVREVAPTHPTLALEFLTGDPRRFWLGGSHDDLGDSVELIGTAGPHLSAEQCRQLAEAIRAWEVYRRRDGESDDTNSEYARGRRHRLLAALPADRLADGVRCQLETDRAELSEYARTPRPQQGSGMEWVRSPVSHAEMAEQSDDEILALFDGFPDATEGHDPNDWTGGGSVQASREFKEFAKLHAGRAAAIVPRFRSADQQRPAGHGVEGLVEAGRPCAEVIELVLRLDGRGFTGQEFRATVAASLRELARPDGLPDDACELLERWRRSVWTEHEPACVREEEGREPPRHPTSVVWHYGGSVSVPQGRFSVLDALTAGYLSRKPHAADRWLMMLQDHVEREETEVNWQVMCLYLPDVRCCSDLAAAGAFLQRLFELFPGVLTCELGAQLLAEVAHLLPDEARQAAYASARGRGDERGPQAFGELVALRHLLHPEETWAGEQVESAFTAPDAPDREWVKVGVAFAAVNQWLAPGCRVRATELIRRLIPVPSARVGYAAMFAFRTRGEIPMDDSTLAVFRQVRNHPEFLARSEAYDAFFEHLLDALVVHTELVCRVGEQAVQLLGADLQSFQNRVHMASPALIDIALRLQRRGGDYRAKGMTLFEELLDSGVAEAVSLAASNDLRITPGGYRAPRRTRAARTGRETGTGD